ncbi:MAG: hypothetical protein H6869_08670 [Rhodospirillales bacterium]|nr:hypothetical protein [Rhodospirillales bacterium]
MTDDLEQKLQQQIDTIEKAIIKIRNNELLDISFMDKEVADICQQVIHSEDAAVQALEGKMIEMITKLDELAVELKEYQDRVKQE